MRISLYLQSEKGETVKRMSIEELQKYSVGSYLRKCRKLAGLTQKEVSEELGLETPQFISNVERNISPVPLNRALQWVDCVGANRFNSWQLMSRQHTGLVKKALGL